MLKPSQKPATSRKAAVTSMENLTKSYSAGHHNLRPETTDDAIIDFEKGLFRAYDWLFTVKSEIAGM